MLQEIKWIKLHHCKAFWYQRIEFSFCFSGQSSENWIGVFSSISLQISCLVKIFCVCCTWPAASVEFYCFPTVVTLWGASVFEVKHAEPQRCIREPGIQFLQDFWSLWVGWTSRLTQFPVDKLWFLLPNRLKKPLKRDLHEFQKEPNKNMLRLLVFIHIPVGVLGSFHTW